MMKKIVIPAILAATILVAGVFAYMPIEKASTVHFTITAANVAAAAAATGFPIAGDPVVVLTCTAAALINDIHIEQTDAGGADNTFTATLDPDGGGAHTAVGGNLVAAGTPLPAGATDFEAGGFGMRSVQAAGTVTVTIADVGADDTAATNVTFVVTESVPGSCTAA